MGVLPGRRLLWSGWRGSQSLILACRKFGIRLDKGRRHYGNGVAVRGAISISLLVIVLFARLLLVGFGDGGNRIVAVVIVGGCQLGVFLLVVLLLLGFLVSASVFGIPFGAASSILFIGLLSALALLALLVALTFALSFSLPFSLTITITITISLSFPLSFSVSISFSFSFPFSFSFSLAITL
jgi:hypothetical protein